MMVIRGHFDGKRIVLDEPVPDSVRAPVAVKVFFDGEDGPGLIDQLAELAEADDLPADYSEQHDHYVKGTPRK